jgi:hypothetical protein
MTRWLGLYILATVGLFSLVGFKVLAQSSDGGISLQVAPSPLVSSIKPGESKKLELKIRNNGDKTENLKIELKSFNQDGQSGQININDTAPSDISDWVSFSSATFSAKPGEWFNEYINVNMPKTAGFSYSFVVLISRQAESGTSPSQMAIRGSLAVFTLINVDRSDALRKLEVSNFSVEHRVYEYLPAKFNVTIKNGGNTIVQPYGNIFIQRSSNQAAISTLPLNEAKAYILPNTSRTVSSEWKDGFPVHVATGNNGKPTRLEWNWDNLKNLRIGRYTAKLVGAYNDGQRDIPLEATLTFWVLPWKMLIGLGIVAAILLIGFYTIVKKGVQVTLKRRQHDASINKQE